MGYKLWLLVKKVSNRSRPLASRRIKKDDVIALVLNSFQSIASPSE